MPRVDPAEFESLPLKVFQLVPGFPLHDVWLVELDDSPECSLQDLRGLMQSASRRSLNPIVRGLFSFRSLLGRVLRLDTAPADRSGIVDSVPEELVATSLVAPGTPEGPFQTLYASPTEAAYQALNATVHAILIVTVVRRESGYRFFWATYVKPVGRITALYMRVIDPFRRLVVYPGLENWLKRSWSSRSA